MSIQDITGTMCIGRSHCRLRLASPLPSGKASSTDEAFTRTRVAVHHDMPIEMLFSQERFAAVEIDTQIGTRRQ